MKGKRKLLMWVTYLGCCTFLLWKAIDTGTTDFVGLGVMCGGLAAGLAAVIYGNVEEHRAAANGASP